MPKSFHDIRDFLGHVHYVILKFFAVGWHFHSSWKAKDCNVLGRFDKSDDKSFISILVIGEVSHWEDKSRSMVRLCNDCNLTISDNIIVNLFEDFEEEFGEDYQNKITKTSYRENQTV